MTCATWIALIYAAPVLAQCVEVSGDRVRAGDLAGTLSAFASLTPETEIAIAPLPGISRTLPAAQLSRALGAPVAVDICVKRSGHSLTVDEITTALRKALQDDEAKIAVLDYSRASIPEGQVEFPRSGLVMTSQAPAVWRGRVLYGNGRSSAIWAKVRITKPAKVLVARRTLSTGQVILTADVEEREIEYSSLPPMRDAGKLAGFEAAREIRTGTVIQPWMLRPKTAVRRGDVLRVSVNASGALLSFEAQANSAARVGDRILVRNPLNERFVSVVIRGEGVAEVDLKRTNHVQDSSSSSQSDPHVDDRDVYRETQGRSAGSR